MGAGIGADDLAASVLGDDAFVDRFDGRGELTFAVPGSPCTPT